MKNRTFDEMISHFNIIVSEMQITQKQKMELLGMITAIAMKHNESVKHGHWILEEKTKWFPDWKCSICGGSGRGDHIFCEWCGAKMDEVRE